MLNSAEHENFPAHKYQMPTLVGILIFTSMKNWILGLYEPKKRWISWYFHTYERLKFHAQLSWAWKKFYNLRARLLHYEYSGGKYGSPKAMLSYAMNLA